MVTRDIDFRAGKEYSGAHDPRFLRDTLFWVRTTRIEEEQSALDIQHELHEAFGRKDAKTGMDLAAAVAEEWARRAQGTLLYSQLYVLATIFGCATKPAVPGADPEPEIDPVKLRAGIDAALQEEWAKVLQATSDLREAPTVLGLTAAGDAVALRAHLGLPVIAPPLARPVSRRKRTLVTNQRREDEYSFPGAASTRSVDARVTRASGRAASASPASPADRSRSQRISELKAHCFLGATPLILAVDFGYTECVEALLEAAAADGPDTLHAVLAAKGHSHYNRGTALTFAVLSERYDILLALVRAGADVNQPVADPLTAGGPPVSPLQLLLREALKGHGKDFDAFVNVLDLLKRDPNLVNAPLVREREKRPWRRSDELRGEEESDNEEGADQPGPSRRATTRRDAGTGAGSDAGGSDDSLDYTTALHGVSRSMGRISTSHTLSSARGTTMLDLAAESTRCVRVDIIKALLAAGATPIPRTLFAAVKSLDTTYGMRGAKHLGAQVVAGIAALHALLGAAADINAPDNNTATTPLHDAAERGCVPAVKVLLARNANTSVEDECGWTPQKVAEEHGHGDVVRVFEKHHLLRRLLSGSSGDSPLRSQAAAEAAAEVPPDQTPCIICRSKPNEVILAPCGHKYTCKKCTKIMILGPVEDRKCPVCRERIDSYVVKVFSN